MIITKKSRVIITLLLVSLFIATISNVFAENIVVDSDSIVNVETTGTVTPVTITATVPTAMTFAINPNNETPITTVPTTFTNKSKVPINIEFLGFKAKNGNKTKVVNHKKHTDDEWKRLKNKDTESSIALGLKDSSNKEYWSDDESTPTVCNTFKYAQNETKELSLLVKAGHAWTKSTTLSYDMNIRIKVVDKSPIVYTLATDNDFKKDSWGNYRYIGKAEYIEIPHTIGGVPVTNMESMFYEYPNEIKGIKSTNPNLTDLSNAFAYIKGKSLDLSQFDTSNVTKMSYAFSNCAAEHLDLTNFNTSKVTDMASMFGSSKAKSIDMSSFDTSKVTKMAYMFSGSEAERLDLSNFDTSKVTDMSNMFENAKATSYNIRSFDTSNVVNMLAMFSGTKAETLDLSNFELSKDVKIGYSLSNTKATIVYVKDIQDLTKLVTSKSRPVTCVVKLKSPTYTMAKDTDFNGNASGNFQYIGHAEYVEIPSVIRGCPVKSYHGMFKNYSSKTLKGIKSLNGNVTDMIDMFWDCDVPTLDLGELNTSGVTDMTGMFRGCKATALNIAYLDTSNVTNMYSMFYQNCAEALDISGFNTAKVTNMGYMFKESKAIYLGIDNIKTNNVTNMANMFESSSATNLFLNSFNTEKVTDMSSMFAWAKSTSISTRGFTNPNMVKVNNMFCGTKSNYLRLDGIDFSKVSSLTGIFFNVTKSEIYVKSQSDINILTNAKEVPATCTLKMEK